MPKIVVMQCAGRKDPQAGYFRTAAGQPVVFVAHPEEAPRRADIVYAHPDQMSDDGQHTWRQRLLSYNSDAHDNEFGLLPAWELYLRHEYRELVAKFGEARVFILSAGWGLIRSEFRTPYYDVTVARPKSADRYKWRRLQDRFDDFCQIPSDTDDEIVLIASEPYRPLFERLTQNISTKKTVYHLAGQIERAPGFTYEKYASRMSRNWQYRCAKDLIAGRLQNYGPERDAN